jgi:hypothetical protein
MRVGITLTLSLGEKAKLRKFLEKWRGQPFTHEELQGFDISKLVGQPCQALVTHSTKGEKTYANIDAILKWPAGTPKPQATETLYFSLEDHALDAYRTKIPKWLVEALDKRKADNWETFNAKHGKGANGATPPPADLPFDDDIPF